MSWSTEAALALLIAALYLKDCLLLLRPNEAVLVKARTWRAGFGLLQWTLAGREPYWAHPLLPHQAVFRLQWDMLAAPPTGGAAVDVPTGGAAVDPPTAGSPCNANAAAPSRAAAPALDAIDAIDAPPRLAALRRLGPWVWLSWLLLFVALPLTVLGRWGITATLTALACLYLSIMLSLAWVWWARHDLGLNAGSFALLAFECLACAPYAANLVRRLSWRPPAPEQRAEDFVHAAHRLLTPAAWEPVRSACLARVQDQWDAEPENTPRARALQKSKQSWAALSSDAGQGPPTGTAS